MDATEWVLALNDYAHECLDMDDDDTVNRLTMTVLSIGSQLGLSMVVNEDALYPADGYGDV